jgi:colanic acid biosynthesis protein WcaH
MQEVMVPQRDVRGHFISLLYRCRLLAPPAESLQYTGGTPQAGQWQWHAGCPDNLIAVHGMYRDFINGNGAGESDS